MQRVDHQHQSGLLGCSIDFMQPRVTQRYSVDMRSDFDAAKTKRSKLLNSSHRQ